MWVSTGLVGRDAEALDIGKVRRLGVVICDPAEGDFEASLELAGVGEADQEVFVLGRALHLHFLYHGFSINSSKCVPPDCCAILGSLPVLSLGLSSVSFSNHTGSL